MYVPTTTSEAATNFQIKKLDLTNFKNFSTLNIAKFGFLNCITGLNGSGKTNLLDALHYICLTKSAISSTDAQNIKQDTAFFRLAATINTNGKSLKVNCILAPPDKKVIEVNAKTYTRISEHIGKYPCVIITPEDSSLITEGSEDRRKFIDNAISQVSQPYLQVLMHYNNTLLQRNAFLKMASDPGNRVDYSLLDAYDAQLAPLAEVIASHRHLFFESIKPIFEGYYRQIATSDSNTNSPEIPLIGYKAALEGTTMANLLATNRSKDIHLQRTTGGTHRDDLEFSLSGMVVKKFGSQGQQKSVLLALKLGLCQYITVNALKKPILLLDDIFDKLDETRIENLLKIVAHSATVSQVFLTDARPDKCAAYLAQNDLDATVIHLSNGAIV